MNTDKLNKALAQQQYDFSISFSQNVIKRIKEENFLPDLRWIISGIAASLLLGVLLVYLQDGEVSYDAILGIQSLKSDILNEYNPYN